jgi:universal stress protein E
MDQLSSIVVGMDFSPASRAALEQGVRLARWNQANLLVVHVIDTIVAIDLQEVLTPMVQQVQDALVADAQKAWQSFAPDLEGKSAIEFEIAVNNELIELLRRCRERRANLLILGQAKDHAAGVLASQAVRRAPCEVLLAREGHPGPFKSVVVGIDFSETSRLALESALRITAQDGGQLRIVHVVRPPWTRFHYRAPADAASREFQQRLLHSLRARLEEFCRHTNPDLDWGKPSYEVLENNSHGAGLVGIAARTGADLVVLGTRGRTSLRDVLIGSTAERVVRDAPCSILAIRPG